MRRGLLLFLSLGLLGGLAGCMHGGQQGLCDCQVYPIDHGTPSPIVKPASVAEPIHPVPVASPIQAP